MKGYKGMNKDMTCLGFQFEIGKTYRADGKVKLCKNGFHFCERLVDVFEHYEKGEQHRYFENEIQRMETKFYRVVRTSRRKADGT